MLRLGRILRLNLTPVENDVLAGQWCDRWQVWVGWTVRAGIGRRCAPARSLLIERLAMTFPEGGGAEVPLCSKSTASPVTRRKLWFAKLHVRGVGTGAGGETL
jgi:hypothetical protein